MSTKMKKNQLKQAENQSQSGRSMVEMLGVLAIIGVLSIGGIAGYRWGMDKHVSNQILYEMNLNSAQLAMLLQKGNSDGVTLSLGSPYDDAEPKYRTVDYGFDYGCEEEVEGELHKCFNPDETGYFISALNLPERIANMVIESAPNLQYYVDYEETVADEVENKTDVTIFFDINADATESLPDSEATRPPETTTTEPKPCDEFKQCDPGYFCLSNGCNDICNGNYNSGMATEEESCKNGAYTCEPIGLFKKKNVTVNGNNEIYYYKEEYMNWWSAKRYCKALGKGSGEMVSLEELGCEKGKLGNGVCTGELRKALKCEGEEGCSDFSRVWTRTPYNSDSDNSCNAYSVSLNDGYVGSGLRSNYSIGNYVLCK